MLPNCECYGSAPDPSKTSYIGLLFFEFHNEMPFQLSHIIPILSKKQQIEIN